MSIEDLLEALQNSGDEGPEDPTWPYVGVPKGYEATRTVSLPGEDASMAAPPIWTKADVWSPAGGSFEDRARLQRDMVNAGVFDPDDEFRLGVWDSVTRKRWTELLSFANGAGISDPREALAQWSRGVMTGGDGSPGSSRRGSGSGRAPLSVQLTSPTDIRSIMNQAGKKELGRELTEDELSRAIRAYQGKESAAQTAAYGADVTGATVQAPPDLSTFSLEQVQTDNPVEALGWDIGQAGEGFLDLIRSTGGSQ